jgi:hypothetical protein
MATTQQTKPNFGGQNAVVLKPLNLGTVGGLRTRRTSEQVLQAKIKRQQDLAEKAQKRAQLFQQRQERAAQRAAKAEEKAREIAEAAVRKQQEEADQRAAEEAQRAAIQSGADVHAAESKPSTIMVVEKTPEVEKTLKDITRDFDRFYKHIFDTYGVQFEGTVPELVKRGYISVKMRGYLQPQRKPVEPTSTDTGIAREAVRFMQFYKTVGLTPAWLNKEVRIKDDSNIYVLTGLRGKAHSVVLRRKDDPAQAFTIAAADFKKVLQP